MTCINKQATGVTRDNPLAVIFENHYNIRQVTSSWSAKCSGQCFLSTTTAAEKAVPLSGPCVMTLCKAKANTAPGLATGNALQTPEATMFCLADMETLNVPVYCPLALAAPVA